VSLDSAIARAIAEEVARLLRELAPTGSPDDLVALPGPLQRQTAMHLVRTGRLPATKLGQRWYTTRRHLAALVDEPEAPATKAGFDPASTLSTHARRRHG
jgi:hypothetical protein